MMRTIVGTSLFLGALGAALYFARRARMRGGSAAGAVSTAAETLTAPLGEVAHRVG